MEIKVLGPLTAHEHGVSLVPSAAKPRQILALLALQGDHVVTVPTLMEEIWGQNVPRSAATTLQTYILQLRRKIAVALDGDPVRNAKEVLVTQHGGYLLQVQPGQVDVQEFEQLALSGRGAYDAHDYAAASALLGKALAVWQGPALVDVPVGGVLELEVLRLEEDRMACLERRIDADLKLGRRHRGGARTLLPRRPAPHARELLRPADDRTALLRQLLACAGGVPAAARRARRGARHRAVGPAPAAPARRTVR